MSYQTQDIYYCLTKICVGYDDPKNLSRFVIFMNQYYDMIVLEHCDTLLCVHTCVQWADVYADFNLTEKSDYS